MKTIDVLRGCPHVTADDIELFSTIYVSPHNPSMLKQGAEAILKRKTPDQAKELLEAAKTTPGAPSSIITCVKSISSKLQKPIENVFSAPTDSPPSTQPAEGLSDPLPQKRTFDPLADALPTSPASDPPAALAPAPSLPDSEDEQSDTETSFPQNEENRHPRSLGARNEVRNEVSASRAALSIQAAVDNINRVALIIEKQAEEMRRCFVACQDENTKNLREMRGFQASLDETKSGLNKKIDLMAELIPSKLLEYMDRLIPEEKIFISPVNITPLNTDTKTQAGDYSRLLRGMPAITQ